MGGGLMQRSLSRRALGIALSAAVIAGSFIFPGTAVEAQPAPVTVKAGYGEADATWRVGAGAGQYSRKSPDEANIVTGGDVDPQNFSAAQKDSYGVQSRLSYRAIVVEDAEGDQTAFVKSDSYLAQDYLTRRAGQILAEEGSDVSYNEIFSMASHNHSSPYYTTPSWGVWLFQDVFDIRAFEYNARAMAEAILEAEEGLVPARMGATTIEHDLFKGVIARKGFADDGTPRGFPDDFGDLGLSVVRFDDMSDPAAPAPLATLVNWGMHPEGLDDHDLITGEFVAALERYSLRDTGAPVVFGQGDVGSAEAGPGRPAEVAAMGIPARWSHVGHAQTERGGYVLSRSVVEAWNNIGAGIPSEGEFASTFVPFSSDFDVEAGSAWVPGPYSHPYPSVSNCRTETTVGGSPGVPVAGLPDCERPGGFASPTAQLWQELKRQGVPLPEHYDAPAFTGVEENARILLQAFKLGEVIVMSCSCEAQVDLILNVESRTNETTGDIWDGYDWTDRMDCTQSGGATGDWTCTPKAGDPRPRAVLGTFTITNDEYLRMKAQIHNDAAGWDAPENAVQANSEPSDPLEIWGNFTKEELPEQFGYKLPIAVGHAGDYTGYTVSYREYMSYDHYRKALTSYGPHTADYMNTRLTRLAGRLNGLDPALTPAEIADEARALPDEARQVAVSTALGQASNAAYTAWRAGLPNDKGPFGPVTEPEDITRFDAATFSWIGGSNGADNPTVRVERMVDGEWETFAGQAGEIQTMVRFPKGANALTDTYSGNQQWLWTANFEAFNAIPEGIGSTPAGEYRFVAEGVYREGFADTPYSFESESFRVSPWDGLKVQDFAVEDGVASFTVDASYPKSYTSVFPYIKTEGKTAQGDDVVKNDELGRPFCTTCSFRPWATEGIVQSAVVTIERGNGATLKVAATLGEDGRWRSSLPLVPGDRAYVAAGDVVDNYGETNGSGTDPIELPLPPTGGNVRLM